MSLNVLMMIWKYYTFEKTAPVFHFEVLWNKAIDSDIISFRNYLSIRIRLFVAKCLVIYKKISIQLKLYFLVVWCAADYTIMGLGGGMSI